jgi:IclR family pca regulon transcriptional regulator
VNSLARGLAVISAFRSGDDYLTITQISERIAVSRAAVRRALMTLEALGYLSSRNNLYSLRPKVLCLGHAYRTSNSLLTLAQPLLKEASIRIGSPCGLISRDGDEILCIASSYGSHDHVTLRVEVGARHPLYCTPSGRLFLSHGSAKELAEYFARTELRKLTENTITSQTELRALFPKIRQQRFAIVDRECPPSEYKMISVPVYDHAGNLVSAVGTAVLSQGSTVTVRERVLPALQNCARDLSPIWLSRY